LSMPAYLHSFKPFVGSRSKILILGTMPGPEALRKREYYGFGGNHFWRIMGDLFARRPLSSYADKLTLLKKNRIALWDVYRWCRRIGASDSAIKNERLNDVSGLLRRYPAIRRVFVNGRAAHAVYRRFFQDKIGLAAEVLPSTSPANASLSYADKLRKWRRVKKVLTHV
jgi:methylated-DNA-[protein]-cysteine S-methyltransferase